MGAGVFVDRDQAAAVRRLINLRSPEWPSHPVRLRLEQSVESQPKATPPYTKVILVLVTPEEPMLLTHPFAVAIPQFPEPFAP